MSESTAKNLNKIPSDWGEYVQIHYTAFGMRTRAGRKYSPSMVTLLEQTNGLSLNMPKRNDGSAAYKMDRLSLNALAARFSRSKSTIARVMRALDGENVVRRSRGSRCMEYAGTHEITGRSFPVELWLYNTVFNIDGEERRATTSELFVFAHIKGNCLMPGNKSHTYSATQEEIANELGLSERTVRAALYFWLRVGFLSLPAEDKGRRGQAGKYHLNRAFIGRKRRTKKTSAVKPSDIEVKELAKVADERADRERYYARRRADAERVADENLRRAMKNAQYKSISSELAETERKAAKIEALKLDGLAEVLEQVKTLHARQTAILTGLGMTPNDLVPTYHCQKCSDSGFLPSGRACDCYQRE